MAAPTIDSSKIILIVDTATQEGESGSVVASAGATGVSLGRNSGFKATPIYNPAGVNSVPNMRFRTSDLPTAQYPEYFAKRFVIADESAPSTSTVDLSKGVLYFLFTSELRPEAGQANPGFNPGGASNTALAATFFSGGGLTNFARFRLWDGATDFPSDSNTGLDKWNSSGTPVPWRAAIVSPSASPLASNSLDATDVSAVQIEVSVHPGNSSNRFIGFDSITYVESYSLVGGDAGDPANVEAIFAIAVASPYYAWIGYSSDLHQGLFVPIGFGDGSTSTYVRLNPVAIRFETGDANDGSDQVSTYQIGDNTLGMEVNCSASCDMEFSGVLIGSEQGQTKIFFNVLGSASASFLWSGGALANVGSNTFGPPSDFRSASFIECDRINPSSSTRFSNCAFSNSTDTTGAFDFDGTQNISGSSFSNNAAAINLGVGVTSVTLSSNAFEGNTYDFRIEDSGTVTISVDTNSSTDHPGGFSDAGYQAAKIDNVGGATVVFSVPQLTLTLSGIPNGAEVRLYDLSGSLPSLGNELAGIEANSGTTFDYVYNNPGSDIWVQIIATGFEEFGQTITLGASSATFPVSMQSEVNI